MFKGSGFTLLENNEDKNLPSNFNLSESPGLNKITNYFEIVIKLYSLFNRKISFLKPRAALFTSLLKLN